jgi:putative sigma-54 modulation protein
MLKLNIKGTNLKLEPLVYDYIQEKIGGLDKFIEKDDSVIQTWVEIGISNNQQSGNIYRAEVQICLAGRNIFAEAVNKDIYLAIDAVKDKLQVELKKYKEKQISLYKRGSRQVKKLLHFSGLARLWRKGRIRDEGV